MRTSDVYISAVGVDVPDCTSVRQAIDDGLLDAAVAEESGFLGVAVAEETPAPELAARAARQALERWTGDVSTLGLLLYVDSFPSGPGGWLPQSYLMREVVGGDLLAVGVRQGCNGVFGALELAAAYLKGTATEAVIITASDNMSSPLVNRWQASPGYVLGDGASAAILTRSPGFARLLSVNSVAVPELEGIHRGNQSLNPSTLPVDQPLDLGARMVEFRDSGGSYPDLVSKTREAQNELLTSTLEDAEIGIADIARVALPHGSLKNVRAGIAALGFQMEQSTWDYGCRVGHVMASDQLLSLDHLLSAEELSPGDRILLMGYGPGLGMAAAVVEIATLPSWVGERG
ncbi:ketoacyl-ACP synthase III family protein [Streptomyces stramineus]|uniref:3-oxoacyl-ACP synthase n=1 Tax=Streptomyces stramineus TaxID=173861 RepID=A0ABP3KHL7_9ACTN